LIENSFVPLQLICVKIYAMAEREGVGVLRGAHGESSFGYDLIKLITQPVNRLNFRPLREARNIFAPLISQFNLLNHH